MAQAPCVPVNITPPSDPALLVFEVEGKIQSFNSTARTITANGMTISIPTTVLVETRNLVKVAFEMHARQPDVQLVKEHAVVKSNFTKQLRLSVFEEVNVRAVKNNARGINVAPAHALFNREFFKLSHYDSDKNSSTASLNCCVRSTFETCPAWSNTTRRELSIA
jgi:hypothetical protein